MNPDTTIRVENGHQAVPTLDQTPGPNAARRTPVQTPTIDIHEDANGLVLEADLPGVPRDGVTIHLEDNVLNLSARVAPVAASEGRLVVEEYQHSDFQRSFILSEEVDRDRISAELKNGVLRLNLPKAERAKVRKIEIRSS